MDVSESDLAPEAGSGLEDGSLVENGDDAPGASSGGHTDSGSDAGGEGPVSASDSGASDGRAVIDGGQNVDAANDAPSDSSSGDASDDGGGDAGVGSNCGVGTVSSVCTPQPLGSCTPSYVPPLNAKGSCTAADVTKFYADCIANGADCTGAGLSSQACYRCLWTPSTSSPWGAVVWYQGGSALSLNVGGCYQLMGASVACAAAAEEQYECEIAACLGACELTPDAGTWLACDLAADLGECAPYAKAAAASCPASVVDAGPCAVPNNDDGGFEPYYLAYAGVFCE